MKEIEEIKERLKTYKDISTHPVLYDIEFLLSSLEKEKEKLSRQETITGDLATRAESLETLLEKEKERTMNKNNGAISAPLDRLVIRFFSFIWSSRLAPKCCNFPYHVIKVKGWRTALVDNVLGDRRTITFMFHIFGKYV